MNEKCQGECGRRAAVVSLALRFALTAPPFGLHRVPGQANDRNNKQKKKGDIFDEVRSGTFEHIHSSTVNSSTVNLTREAGRRMVFAQG
jgi:hypothetical protein